MDINKLFRVAMRRCGRVLRVLPKDEIGGSINQYLTDILEDELMPALDILIPYQYQVSFNIEDLTPVSGSEWDAEANSAAMPAYDDRYAIYRIPKKLTKGRGIMGMKSLVPASGNSSDVRYTGFPTGVGIGSTMANQFGRYSSAMPWERSALSTLTYADGLLQGQTSIKFRSYFYEPNILWIVKPYGVDRGMRLTACFLLKNDPTLLTVPEVSFVKVAEMFVLYVRAAIYNQFGYLSEIDTPYGSVNLNIGDWSGCESEAKELFETLQATAHIHNSALKS